MEILPAVGQRRLAQWQGWAPDAIAEQLRRHAEPKLVDQLVDEMEGMTEVLPLVCFAAATAEHRGLELAIEPRLPASPIATARKRRVSIELVIDTERVTVHVAHIPGRHPSTNHRRVSTASRETESLPVG